ncbi:hypothetical protein DY000_02057918 [Brassica cretica]|uniref:non-specific serine/threonine protein kinase n=1 Tax=Brassica cretica TaxID=69181 RepID=A0ABQ7A5S9_BRACR|nr:hypothetical protein DY000_02057918 [Brassica cretica]
MEKYELVKDIGAGNFGVARLMKVKNSKELVAMKYIERGPKIDENVAREIINHRSLRHPNIIRFKEARYFFQQLISGVSYCHAMQICHRDLKLENTLLDGSPAPRLKICDFGYSKRITIAEIKKHPWFLKNLPRELTETAQAAYFKKENPTFSPQTAEEIMKIVDDAKTPPPVSRSIGGFGWGGKGDEEEEEVDEEEVVEEEEDDEDEYNKTVKEAHASGEVRIS